jgi:hypothetical protein
MMTSFLVLYLPARSGIRLRTGFPAPEIADRFQDAPEIEVPDESGGEEDYRNGYHQRQDYFRAHLLDLRFLIPIRDYHAEVKTNFRRDA